MELQEFIKKATLGCGNAAGLAKILDISPNSLSDAKRGQRGLPSHTCVKLAEIINADPLEVIAASEMVTEKKPERQALWRRVLEHRHAAAMICCFALVTLFLTPQNVEAFNNKNLSKSNLQTIYIMSNYSVN